MMVMVLPGDSPGPGASTGRGRIPPGGPDRGDVPIPPSPCGPAGERSFYPMPLRDSRNVETIIASNASAIHVQLNPLTANFSPRTA